MRLKIVWGALILALVLASPAAAQPSTDVYHFDVVQAQYGQQPPEHTVQGALDFTLRVLRALPPGERAGLLRKESGDNIAFYNGVMVSAGRVCYPDGKLYKIATDIPTTMAPVWDDNGTVDPNRYVPVAAAPVPIPTPVPVPTPIPVPPPLPSVDLSVMLARLAAIELRMTQLEEIQRQDTEAIRGDIKSFRDAANNVLKVVAKYVAPVIAGLVGGMTLK